MKKIENVIWGVVLIVLGTIFALNALEITSINVFFSGWWTLFIIIPCFVGLIKDRDKTGSIVGILIGVSLLLCCQNILRFDMILKLAVPVILVVIGLSLIFKDVIKGKINDKIKELNKNKSAREEYCATFGSQDIKFDDMDFKGADLNAIFGGINLDLRNAKINSDTIINASSIFGGIEIFTPTNVKIAVKSTPIFGGVTDKSVRNKDENAVTVYINSTCIFGGVEIK